MTMAAAAPRRRLTNGAVEHNDHDSHDDDHDHVGIVTDSSATLADNHAGAGAGGSATNPVHAPLQRRQIFCIALLFVINLLNYMDRYTIAGILQDVQLYYSLNASSSGLIQTVFICSYMVLAPIFGFLGDRYNRRILLTIGIFLWSVTTFAGSLIPRNYFGWFLFFRALVGVGEASYSTIAPTIIADMFAKQRRSTMLAIFYFAIPVGSGLGYIVGSEVAHATGQWQWALRVTPILGICLDVLIFCFLQEPPRGHADGAHGDTHATNYLTDLKSLLRNKTYMYSTIAFTCVTFTAGGVAMFAPEFMRLAINQSRKMEGSSVSLIFGVITVVAGLVGVSLGSISSQRFGRTSRRADPLICALGMIVCTPFLFLGLLLSRAEPMLTWFLIFTAEVFLCLNWPLVADMLLYCVPPARRGTADAFQILISHALGDAGSPYLIGVVADAIAAGKLNGRDESNGDDAVRWRAMQYSLFITCFFTILAGGFFLLTSLYIEKDRQKAEQETIEHGGNATPNGGGSSDSSELQEHQPNKNSTAAGQQAAGRLEGTNSSSTRISSLSYDQQQNPVNQYSPLRQRNSGGVGSGNYSTFYNEDAAGAEKAFLSSADLSTTTRTSHVSKA